MLKYIVKRALYGILVLALVVTVVFLVLRLVPGNTVQLQLADSPGITQEQIDDRLRDLGLNKPIYEQYYIFIKDLFILDLGESFQDGQSVTSLLTDRFPRTIELGVLAIAIGVLIGIPIGAVGALRNGKLADHTSRIFSVAGMSVPYFWIALMLITYLSILFSWSPPFVYKSPLEDLGSNLLQMIMPAIALSAATMAAVARMLRSTMLETLDADFIRTIRARGASERSILWKHVGRNSLVSIFSVLGLQIGAVLGGTVILESIFAIPGMGSLTFDAVQMRDYPVVLGCVMVYGATFIVVNLVVDVLYAVADPRIRY